MTQVEIREADVTVVANKDILGLDVSVVHFIFVHFVQHRIKALSEILDHFLFRKIRVGD